MSEKFTPGPWFVRRRKARKEFVYHRKIMFGNACELASLCTSSPYAERKQSRWMPNDTTMEANAALIAAAPELYEALKNIASYIGDLSEYYGFRDEFLAARAALKKAQGE